MQKLLSIEWLKLKNYRTFWILTALYLVLLPLFNYEIENGMGKFNVNGVNIMGKPFAFPEVWGYIGYFGSYFITFLAILVIILTTNEYNFKTNRQNVIDGWKRLDFLHAKIFLVLAFSIVATVYFFILGAGFGLANSGSVSELFSGYDKITYFFLLSVNYMGFALLIALLIKRSGLAISLFLLYAVIIENIVKQLLNWRMDGNYGNYLPLQSSDELLPFPIPKMAASIIGSSAAAPILYYVVATIVWCAIYYFICRAMLLRNDW